MRTWKLAALAALILGMLAAPARAGEVSESITNKNIAGPPGYVWDGTRWRRMTGTSDGAANVTEAYPGFLQESGATIVSADTMQVGKANTTNPLTAAGLTPYSITGPNVWARIKCTGIAANYPWSVRFYGSRDATNYAPLMRSTGYWVVASARDTLKVIGRGPTGTNGDWFPLASTVPLALIAPQLIAVCSNDSGAATVGSTATFTVEIAQRK